ncbi:hypothetical protein [Vibrio gallicus]|uniref:hypothetical protein n=1 Tax=Vibrio gallicus TaxID=190897 RepID=UPI0021C36859|nr:hypothetical protein [Vibrio gallicus]
MNKSNLVIKAGLLLAMFSLSTTVALANPITSDISNTDPDDVQSEQTFTPSWVGAVSVTYADNWANDYRDNRNVDFDLQLGYQFTNNFSAGVITGAYYLDTQYCSTHTKDYWCASSTYLYANYANLYQFGDFTTVGLKGRILLPTSQYSRDTELYFGTSVYVPFSFDVNRYIDGLSLVFQPSATKYFNKYESIGGSNLVEYTFGLGLASSYQITDNLSFSFSMTDSYYITYQGYTKYPTISHSEEFDYTFTDNLYVGLGYTNSAQYFNPDKGPNPVSGLFDDKDPNYYVSVGYSF